MKSSLPRITRESPWHLGRAHILNISLDGHMSSDQGMLACAVEQQAADIRGWQ